MANRAESEKPWEVNLDAPEFMPQPQQDLEEKSLELAKFLAGAPVDMIQINSIMPNAKTGILFNVTLGKLIAINNGVEEAMLVYNTDSSAFTLLANGIELMSKKKQKKQKHVIKNMSLIKDYISNPLNWGPLYNNGNES